MDLFIVVNSSESCSTRVKEFEKIRAKARDCRKIKLKSPRGSIYVVFIRFFEYKTSFIAVRVKIMKPAKISKAFSRFRIHARVIQTNTKKSPAMAIISMGVTRRLNKLMGRKKAKPVKTTAGMSISPSPKSGISFGKSSLKKSPKKRDPR
jgi:hypothetical protein